MFFSNTYNCERQRHKFEPRYDKGPCVLDRANVDGSKRANEALEKYRKITYIHDICIYCGKIVRKDGL